MNDLDDETETKLSPAARRSLSEIKALYEPAPQDFQRIRNHVAQGLALGVVASAVASAGPAAASATKVLAIKWSLALTVVGGLTAATLIQLRGPASPEAVRPPDHQVADRSVSANLGPHQPRDPVALDGEPLATPEPQAADPELPASEPPRSETGSAEHLPNAERIPSQAAALLPTEPAPDLPAGEASPPAVQLERTSELILISRAQRALARGEDEALLAILREHQTEFPEGLLAEEREAIRAIASCRRLRQTSPADPAQYARIRADFERQYTQAFAIDRVRRECAPE